LPAYAVGEATAAAAREAGFDIAATGDAGVERLLGSIDPDTKLLHLCGQDRRSPTDARQRIKSIPVYCAKVVDKPDLGSADGCVAVVHSSRAAGRFAELVRDRGSIAIAAISEAAADAVGTGWQIIETAERPADEPLLALAARLCNNPPPE
jgi:uroporphyrinogen-III synthase